MPLGIGVLLLSRGLRDDDFADNADDANTVLEPLASRTTCGPGSRSRHRGFGPQRPGRRCRRRWCNRAVHGGSC